VQEVDKTEKKAEEDKGTRRLKEEGGRESTLYYETRSTDRGKSTEREKREQKDIKATRGLIKHKQRKGKTQMKPFGITGVRGKRSYNLSL